MPPVRNNSDVTVSFTCTDSLSGVATVSQPTTLSSEGANQSVSGTCTDKAGNSASSSIGSINIDKTPPTVATLAPTNGATYSLNAVVAANYSCADPLSGISMCTGTVANGSAINTASIGSHTFSVTATDKAGNSASANNTYTVQYVNGGTCDGAPGHTVLQPVATDGSSVFKQGSDVPVKFRVCDANGVSIGTAGLVTKFALVKTVNGTAVNYVDEPVISNTPDTAFQWDSTARQWIFNLSTKDLKVGFTYYYTIWLNDGTTINFQFGLR